MRTFAQAWEAIAGVVTDFKWIYLLEGLVIYLLVYYVVKILSDNNAKKLIPIYVLLVLCMGVITLFSDGLNAAFFCVFVMLVSEFFLLLFSVEIKRSIWNVKKISRAPATSEPKARVRAEECVSGIVKAVQNMSKNNIGALIVLSNGNLPKEILESGVSLNATISSQLVEGIFFPKAPLHDGAMIIYGDKIQAAGCFLPLTQKDYPKDYGTRHRAGIGVTEVADVMTIIVSEETGIVSVVKRGSITRYVDSDLLRKFLREYYWKEFAAEVKAK